MGFAFLKLSILEIFLFPHPLSREKGNVEITDFQIFSHNFSSLPTFLPLTFTRLPNTPILFFFFSVPPFSPPARLSVHFSHPPTLSSQQGFMGFEVGWSSAVSNCSCILAWVRAPSQRELQTSIPWEKGKLFSPTNLGRWLWLRRWSESQPIRGTCLAGKQMTYGPNFSWLQHEEKPVQRRGRKDEVIADLYKPYVKYHS